MKRLLSALLSVIVLLSLSPVALAATSFSDVPKSHWAYKYIEQMAAEGVLTGYADGTFQPDTPMKRSEFAVTLAKIAKLPLKSVDSSYNDVNAHWSKQYVVAVSSYVDGISATAFEPDSLITREATVSALVKIKGYDTSTVYTNPEGINDFGDVSPAFQTYVAYALTHNMVNGYSDNTFRPQNSLTRAEASTLLYKAFRYEIDTVASNLTAFRSMVMDNDNNLYYINGNTIFSTKSDMTLDITTDFGGSTDASYLAYDPYSDIVYLITDKGWKCATT